MDRETLVTRLANLAPEERQVLRERWVRQSRPTADVGLPRVPNISLFFFSDTGGDAPHLRYDLLLECARVADQGGLHSIWLPERHFDKFGGPYPNPSVLAAALAVATRRVRLRAGSVVLPLHHPVRVAEEWSVVDNLSGGRVGISFASGWNPDDFLLAQRPYHERKQALTDALSIVQRLWKGERLVTADGVSVETFPKPVQADLPIWLTASGNDATWIEAARAGLNVLTALLEQGTEEMAQRAARYRAALIKNGHDPQQREITVMLHTYVGETDEVVEDRAKPVLKEYLRSHLAFYERTAQQRNLGVRSEEITTADRETLLDIGVSRYLKSTGLFGTLNTCYTRLLELRQLGVTEVACLVNFGLPDEQVIDSVHRLCELQQTLIEKAVPKDK